MEKTSSYWGVIHPWGVTYGVISHRSETLLLNQIVPPRFLFRWSFPARNLKKIPKSSGRLLDLPEECLLPSLGELDQQRDFATVKLAWNDDGLGVSVEVSGRSHRPQGLANENDRPDGVWLWVNTRNTQTVHRATRFCHHFLLLPIGGGPKQADPVVRPALVARAREENPLPDAELVQIQSEVTRTGYWLDAWFPKEVFVGFEPETHGQIGFHYLIHDSELGDQTLAVGAEFPYESDPSLWQTVELNR